MFTQNAPSIRQAALASSGPDSEGRIEVEISGRFRCGKTRIIMVIYGDYRETIGKP